jgi:hypothetical protein
VPIFQEMTETLNRRFNRENIASFRKGEFAPGELVDIFQSEGLIRSDLQAEFVRSIPESLRAALRAIYTSAVNRSPPVPVTIAWMPGYDYEVTVSESAGTPDSIGGITVLVRTRYPRDPHPSRRGRSAR